MKRSGGITASAVISIAGSVVSILFGGLMVMTAIISRIRPLPSPASDQPVLTVSPVLMFAIMSIFYVAFGIWGIVSAIGLLRLRNWARICFAVFGGILCFFSLCGAFGVLMASQFMPQA